MTNFKSITFMSIVRLPEIEQSIAEYKESTGEDLEWFELVFDDANQRTVVACRVKGVPSVV